MGVPRDSLMKPKPLLKDSLIVDSLKLANKENIKQLEEPVDTAALLKQSDADYRKLPTQKPRFVPNSNRAIWSIGLTHEQIAPAIMPFKVQDLWNRQLSFQP